LAAQKRVNREAAPGSASDATMRARTSPMEGGRKGTRPSRPPEGDVQPPPGSRRTKTTAEGRAPALKVRVRPDPSASKGELTALASTAVVPAGQAAAGGAAQPSRPQCNARPGTGGSLARRRLRSPVAGSCVTVAVRAASGKVEACRGSVVCGGEAVVRVVGGEGAAAAAAGELGSEERLREEERGELKERAQMPSTTCPERPPPLSRSSL